MPEAIEQIECVLCQGRGGDVEMVCGHCGGCGADPQSDLPDAACPECLGSATIQEAICPRCNGEGAV